MTEIIQIATTVESKADAARIAAALVKERLAACVQVSGPLESTYWWKDQLETSQEWLCTVKTMRKHFPQVETRIRQLHSYEVPEVLAIPVVAASADYAQWLMDQLKLTDNHSSSP